MRIGKKQQRIILNKQSRFVFSSHSESINSQKICFHFFFPPGEPRGVPISLPLNLTPNNKGRDWTYLIFNTLVLTILISGAYERHEEAPVGIYLIKSKQKQ